MAICLSSVNLLLSNSIHIRKIKAKEVSEVLHLTLYAIINLPRGFEFYMKSSVITID